MWPAVDGQQVAVTQGLIDSGDFTSEIYDLCNRTSVRICPSKGTGARDGRLIRSTKEAHGLFVLLYLYSDYHAKVTLYISKLQKHLAPRVWFPQDSDQEFLRAHMGQRLMLPRGGTHKDWRRVPNDHHGDCTKLHLIAQRIINPLPGDGTVAEPETIYDKTPNNIP